jgi:hypothetical protein
MANSATARTGTQGATASPACDHYLSKKAACVAATTDLITLIESLRRFAAPLLADWSKCHIELAGAATPGDMVKSRKAVVGDNVPTVQQLQHALVHHYQAQLEATQAWNVLSRAEQKKVGRPPWLKR